MTLRLTPEEALLVAAAAGTFGSTTNPPDGEVRWDRLLDLAGWHRLLPLLWDQLNVGRSPITPPDDVAAALRQAARETTARNLNLGIELDRVLAVLGAEDIPVVLLKGAALLEEVYEHPGLRPMADLDLLVPRADIGRAHEAVIGLGYAVRGARLHRDDEAWLAVIHHHLPLVKQDGAVMVELHHQLLVDRPSLDVGAVWARAVPSPRAPVHLLPAPEDLLLHVAAHFALDRMNRGESSLGQLADVVRIVQRWDIDWDDVVAQARRAHVADRLFLALDAAAKLFGDLAPHEVVSALAPPSYTRRLGEMFLRQRVLLTGPSFPLEQIAGGRRRLFPGPEALELYIRDDDDVLPSHARLHLRRIGVLARRVARDVPRPRELARDIRLSRWMLSLRD